MVLLDPLKLAKMPGVIKTVDNDEICTQFTARYEIIHSTLEQLLAKEALWFADHLGLNGRGHCKPVVF